MPAAACSNVAMYCRWVCRAASLASRRRWFFCWTSEMAPMTTSWVIRCQPLSQKASIGLSKASEK